MQTETVYLNGEYLALADAKISVMDRGFLFGDGVYEVIPAYAGKLFRLEDHLERLDNSLKSIRLQNPHSHEQWRTILSPLLKNGQDQSVYLQITRGVAPKRDHAFPQKVTPTVFAMVSGITPHSDPDNGVKAVSMEDSRWKLCDTKAITLLANVLLRQAAVEQGCAEAILFKDGYLTEGAASNVFAVIDGILVTAPKSPAILPGITRDVILEIARKNDIPSSEQAIAKADIQKASELWITSSTREIIPVVELDGEKIADGKPGLVWKMFYKLFQEYKQSLR
ncbi:D-alanine aminotransferase Dat [Methyloglobulus morosus KoM1]|uniref:Aminodeoxychorismate lyase n=1 Tax=Methyloglobulus morosus KoM1 TaxID=1116472 RepID=V5BEZ6_9GAMM|nr:D-amino acid aminotransferase [Methyloglobulus morosus]ESS71865.1 D-alanine aminotransferase Dat [Methyloglobulus morosus KoM1]